VAWASARSRQHTTFSAICANTTVAMDNSSAEDMASIVRVNDKFFDKHFIEESSGLDSDDDFDLMVAMTSIFH
jgi:hypothetical protein